VDSEKTYALEPGILRHLLGIHPSLVGEKKFFEKSVERLRVLDEAKLKDHCSELFAENFYRKLF
jgi:hypothetical protein